VVKIPRLPALFVVTAVVLVACSGSGGDGGNAPTSTGVDNPATVTDPSGPGGGGTPAPDGAVPGGPEADVVPRVAAAPRLVVSGPGLGGAPVEVLDEVADGALVFVEELSDGRAGTVVTVADADLVVRHRVEVDQAPFVSASGWPGTAILMVGTTMSLLDAESGEVVALEPPGGGELVLAEVRTGHRYAAAVEVGGGEGAFLVDFDELALVPIGGTLRSGPPEFSSDGQWVVAVTQMGDRGAQAVAIVRPDRPDRALVTVDPIEGELLEQWFFGPDGHLWVTSRPVDTRGERLVHEVDPVEGSVVAWYRWDGDDGHRLVAVGDGRHLLEERASGDHLIVDLDGQVLARVPRPSVTPILFGSTAAYIDENEVLLLDLGTGSAEQFEAVGSPTPSELDLGTQGQFWIADGYAKGEIGLFRVDLGRRLFVDHRSAVAGLPEGEHFFSFDPTRFRADGTALVAYQGEERSWLVVLGADGSSERMALPDGHRATDISLAPSGRRAVVLSGVRSTERRESIASIVDLGSLSSDSNGDRLQGQRLVLWLTG
jgi:hypothetical protein